MAAQLLLFPEPTPEHDAAEAEVPTLAPRRVERGDLWQLGAHRLLCGDATSAEDVARLMGGVKASACITDPPYPRQFAHLYGGVAALLPTVLERGGSYVAIVPHYLLPRVLNDVGQHLKYRWISSMWQAQGAHPRMAMGIEVTWKPLVWWVNEAWPRGRGFVVDGFENAPVKKHHHIWEQSESWALYGMKFVPLGGLVFEPFAGGGTMYAVCQKQGRHCYGMEIEPHYCDIILRRWEQMTGNRAVLIDRAEDVRHASQTA